MATANDLRNDYEYLNAIRTVMEERGQDTSNMTTEDLYDWGIENYRWMNANVVSATDEASRVITGSDEEKGAYGTYYKKLADADGTFWDDPWGAVKDYAGATVTDPTTWIGVVTGGTGKAASFGVGAAARTAMQGAFREGVKKGIANGLTREAASAAAREAVKKSVARQVAGAAAKKIGGAAMVEGGASALTDYSIQKTEQAAGLRDEVSQKQVALAGGIGAATAGVLEGAAGYLAGRGQARSAGRFSEIAHKGEAANRARIEQRLAALGQDKSAIDVFKEATDYANKTMADREAQLLRESGQAVVDDVTGNLITRSPFGNALQGSSNPLTGTMVKTGLDNDVARRVGGALTEIWQATGVKHKKGKGTFARTIQQAMGDPNLNVDTVARIARDYGLTWGELRDSVYLNASEAGKTLNVWSQLAKKLGNETTIGQAEFAAAVKGRQEAGAIVQGWKRLDNWRRGLLVTQLATTARNGASTVYRGGADTLVNAVEYGMAKLTGNAYQGQFTQIADPLRFVFANPKLAGEMYDATMKNFGAEADRMLGNIADFNIHLGTDGSRLGRIGQTIDKGVALANGLNNYIDSVAKKGAFVAALRKKLGRQGLDFETIVRNGDVSRLDPKLIAEAVDEAMGFTFQGPSKGGLFNWWEKKMAGADNPIEQLAYVTADFFRTSLVPFPRFMTNSIKYLTQHSPVGLMYAFGDRAVHGASHANRQALAKGIVGTAMLGGLAAYRYDTLEMDGTDQGEFKMDDGRYLDLNPYFPVAPMMYFADAWARMEKGMHWQFDLKKFLGVISGSNFRVGSGVYAVDQLINDTLAISAEYEDTTKATAAVERLLGNYFGGFFATAGTMKDVYANFDEDAMRVRDNVEAPFEGALGRYVPHPLKEAALEAAGKDPSQNLLPPASTLTSGDKLYTQSPIAKQLTGANIRADRNVLEERVKDLGIPYTTTKQKAVDPAFERLIDKLAYPVIESEILPQMEEAWFKEAHPHYQKLWIKEQMQDVKKAAREYAAEVNPELATFEEFYRKSKDDQRSTIMDMGITDKEGADLLESLRVKGRENENLPPSFSMFR